MQSISYEHGIFLIEHKIIVRNDKVISPNSIQIQLLEQLPRFICITLPQYIFVHIPGNGNESTQPPLFILQITYFHVNNLGVDLT